MTVGAQFYDTSGNLISDLTTRWVRIHASVTINSGNQSGSTNVSTLSEGDFVYICDSYSLAIPPTVSISGTTVTWTQNSYGDTWNGELYLGSY